MLFCIRGIFNKNRCFKGRLYDNLKPMCDIHIEAPMVTNWFPGLSPHQFVLRFKTKQRLLLS